MISNFICLILSFLFSPGNFRGDRNKYIIAVRCWQMAILIIAITLYSFYRQSSFYWFTSTTNNFIYYIGRAYDGYGNNRKLSTSFRRPSFAIRNFVNVSIMAGINFLNGIIADGNYYCDKLQGKNLTLFIIVHLLDIMRG